MFKSQLQKDSEEILKRLRHPWFIFFAITLVFFGFSLSYDPFIFDDYFHVFGNTKVLNSDISSWLYYLTKSLTPIPFLFWKMVALFSPNGNPFAFRIFNLIFHSLNTYLVFELSKMVFKKLGKNENSLPFIAALFYLLHPVQVESVVWVSSLRNLQATFFALTSILLFIHNEEKNRETHPLILHFPTFLLFALGMLCNPSIAPAIFVGPFLKRFFYQSKGERSLWFLAVLLPFVIGFIFLHKETTMSSYFADISLWVRIQIIFSALTVYFLNIFLPFQISFDYQVNAFVVSYLEEVGQNMALITMGPMLVITSLALFIQEKTKVYGSFLILFLLLLTPHCGFILHDFNNISVVSDRYLNLALTPLAILFSLVLSQFLDWMEPKFQKLKTTWIIGFIFFGLGFLTVLQVEKWNDTERLLKSNQFLTETRPSTLNSLAGLYMNHQNYGEARVAYKAALALDADSPAALLGLLESLVRSPKASEEDFVLHYFESNPVTITDEMYPYLIKIYLKRMDLRQARALLNNMKATSLDQRKASLLEEDVKNAGIQFLTERYRGLETYHQGIKDFEQAIFYGEKLLEIYPGNPAIKQRLKHYYEEKYKSRQKEAPKSRQLTPR